MNISISLEELRKKAKELGLKGYSKLSKQELFEELIKFDRKEKNLGEVVEVENNEKEMQEDIKFGSESVASAREDERYTYENLSNNPEYSLITNHEFSSDYKMYYEKSTGRKIILRKNKKRIILEPNTTLVRGYFDMVPEKNYGFLRDSSLRISSNDTYVTEGMIERFKLSMGDYIVGVAKEEKLMKTPPLIYIIELNYADVDTALNRVKFENLTPIYPNKRIDITVENVISNRIISMFSPIGYGQRGLIVSPPKAGKTTIISSIGKSFRKLSQEDDLMVLLVDERPEEVTEMEEIIDGHVISSTFDKRPEDHIRMAEFALEIAKRKVEAGRNVILLLDSITRLARAYNLVVPSSGKLLSGGFDPHALFKPKYLFGAARNTKEAGSLTIIATSLIETGSRMDDLIYEEFKGTGNMELHLDRELAEKRMYPAINIKKSSTRRDELLYPKEEKRVVDRFRIGYSNLSDADMLSRVNMLMKKTNDNNEVVNIMNEKLFKND